MTQAAQEFIRPLTFAALSGEKVITGMFRAEEQTPNIDSAVEHIALAQSIDCLLVAPATADILAKFAQGMANDFLTTLYLAATAPVVVAPAMNVNMWNHPATQANLEILKKRGVKVVDPGEGYLACGMTGSGRLAENASIVAAVLESLGAEAALRRGARVLLVSGPTALKPPSAAELTWVESAEEMRQAALALLPRASVVIKTAAVSDYRPKSVSGQKIKRAGSMSVELEPTADILAELVRHRQSQIMVGFAAESENVLENARRKLLAKSLDAVVVNDISQEGVGFDSERNAVTILTHQEVVEVPVTTKWEVAQRVLDQVVRLRKRSPVAS
jgi:phosphopantothenoylcysteine decarboxylase/phosphopantothenate--cysteine ligase